MNNPLIQVSFKKEDAAMWVKLKEQGWNEEPFVTHISIFGDTPLTIAVVAAPEYVEKLIKMGSDIDHVRYDGSSVLSLALEFNPSQVLPLLKAGASINLIKDNCFPLQSAWYSSNVLKVWPILKEFGLDVTLSPQGAEWGYLGTSCHHQPTLVPEIIEMGAGLNFVNVFGYTPLMEAAIHNPQLIPLLIEKGADIHFMNDEGLTVFDVSKECIEQEGDWKAWDILQGFINQGLREKMEDSIPKSQKDTYRPPLLRL